MLAVTGTCAAVLLKCWKAELLPFLRLALSLLFAFAAIHAVSPLVESVTGLLKMEEVSTYATVLFKALGVAVLTETCASLCRECGENAAATGMELVGKVELLLLALPLIGEILSVAESLLALGQS